MRRIKDITEAQEEFFDKLWYHRSLLLREKVLSSKDEMPPENIMDGAGQAREQVEAKYSVNELAPYSDFELGMINGKLSALRWVMGDDWDMLDT